MMHTAPLRWKPNVTVAAVIEKDGRILLIEEETADGLKLNNPAGHLDPGETPAEGCAREAMEESAYEFKATSLVGIYISRFTRVRDNEDITYLRFAFAGEVGAHHPDRPLDDGIVRAIWMTPDEIRACPERHRSPLLLRCLEDFLAGQRFPLSAVYSDPSVTS